MELSKDEERVILKVGATRKSLGDIVQASKLGKAHVGSIVAALLTKKLLKFGNVYYSLTPSGRLHLNGIFAEREAVIDRKRRKPAPSPSVTDLSPDELSGIEKSVLKALCLGSKLKTELLSELQSPSVNAYSVTDAVERLVSSHKLVLWCRDTDLSLRCVLTPSGSRVTEVLRKSISVSAPWHQFFLSMATLAASRSRDTSTKVGAVLVDEHYNVRGVGYNGFPRGVNDTIQSRYDRPEKYLWTCHAEENVILSAARNGICTSGCTLYCTHAPCSRCARGIIQAGIVSVVVPASGIIPTMQAELELGATMLKEAGVTIVRLETGKHTYHD